MAGDMAEVDDGDIALNQRVNKKSERQP